MMIIDVHKLNAQKIFSGECEFTYEAPESTNSVPLTTFASPVRVKISYWLLEDDSVEIKGTVTYELQGSCSRCLKETKKTFSSEIDAYFVKEGKKVEEEDYVYDGETIDLTECVNETILFGMPYVLLCNENCEPIEWNA